MMTGWAGDSFVPLKGVRDEMEDERDGPQKKLTRSHEFETASRPWNAGVGPQRTETRILGGRGEDEGVCTLAKGDKVWGWGAREVGARFGSDGLASCALANQNRRSVNTGQEVIVDSHTSR